jgi:hypothetical protein
MSVNANPIQLLSQVKEHENSAISIKQLAKHNTLCDAIE